MPNSPPASLRTGDAGTTGPDREVLNDLDVRLREWLDELDTTYANRPRPVHGCTIYVHDYEAKAIIAELARRAASAVPETPAPTPEPVAYALCNAEGTPVAFFTKQSAAWDRHGLTPKGSNHTVMPLYNTEETRNAP